MSLNTSAPVSGKGVLRKVTRFDGGGDALQKRIIHHPDGVAVGEVAALSIREDCASKGSSIAKPAAPGVTSPPTD